MKLLASIGAFAAVAATLALASGGAAATGTTYTITTVKQQGSTWVAGGGKAMHQGRLSAGDQLFETNTIRRSDGKTGRFIGTVVVASPGTVTASAAVGLLRAIYRFADGDVYVDGSVAFATGAGSGVIVGGTGTYAGAHGTLSSTGSKDLLRLDL